MATDRESLYNIALRAIGERSIGSLTEDREPRRLLDEVFNAGSGAIKYWLEQGLWNHAIRTITLDASASDDPAFGLDNAFTLPSDFVRLVQIDSGENFSGTLMRYEIEAGFIYADLTPIYLRFVSNGDDFGGDLSLWPETFTLWCGTWLGLQIAPRVMNDKDKETLRKETKRLLVDARSKDAQQEPPRFPPLSSWARARYGSRSGRRDRGSRSQLIG